MSLHTLEPASEPETRNCACCSDDVTNYPLGYVRLQGKSGESSRVGYHSRHYCCSAASIDALRDALAAESIFVLGSCPALLGAP